MCVNFNLFKIMSLRVLVFACFLAATALLLWCYRVELLRKIRRWKRRRHGKTARERKLHRSRMNGARNMAPLQLVLDCSFVSSMNDKELRSLALQAQTLYSVVRRCPVPAKVAITSCDLSEAGAETGSTAARFFRRALIQFQPRSWDASFIRFDARDFASMHLDGSGSGSGGGDVVYMSPDGAELLERVEPGTTYVFGGIVDRSHSSNLSADRAADAGVRTARLPLREHGEFPIGRPCVLNIDTAVRIVLAAHAAMATQRGGGGDDDEEWARVWRDAIRSNVPARMLRETRSKTERSELPATRAALDALSNGELRQLNLKGRLLNGRIGAFRFERSEFGRGETRWTSRVIDAADGTSVLGVGVGRTGKSADSVAAWEALRYFAEQAEGGASSTSSSSTSVHL